MSKKKNHCCVPVQCCCQPVMEPICAPVQSYSMETCNRGSKCSFSCLIILILILLQFSNGGSFFGCRDHDCCDGGFSVDRGIIFIIALYYLSCVCPCA